MQFLEVLSKWGQHSHQLQNGMVPRDDTTIEKGAKWNSSSFSLSLQPWLSQAWAHYLNSFHWALRRESAAENRYRPVNSVIRCTLAIGFGMAGKM
jgi:hypothetical protein